MITAACYYCYQIILDRLRNDYHQGSIKRFSQFKGWIRITSRKAAKAQRFMYIALRLGVLA